MKQLSIFMGIFIIFYTTACTDTSNVIRERTLAQADQGEGGNPEVKNRVNYCLKLKTVAQHHCLEKLYPQDQNILIHPSHEKRIKLATRGHGVERKSIELKGEKRLLLYIDRTYLKSNLFCNIKNSTITEDRNTLVIDILTENIEDRVTLKDKEGKILLDYTIIKSKD